MAWLPAIRKNHDVAKTTSEIVGKVKCHILLYANGKIRVKVGDYELQSIRGADFNPNVKIKFYGGQDVNIQHDNCFSYQDILLDDWQADTLIDVDKKAIKKKR